MFTNSLISLFLDSDYYFMFFSYFVNYSMVLSLFFVLSYSFSIKLSFVDWVVPCSLLIVLICSSYLFRYYFNKRSNSQTLLSKIYTLSVLLWLIMFICAIFVLSWLSILALDCYNAVSLDVVDCNYLLKFLFYVCMLWYFYSMSFSYCLIFSYDCFDCSDYALACFKSELDCWSSLLRVLICYDDSLRCYNSWLVK